MKSKYVYDDEEKLDVGSALVIQNLSVGTPRSKNLKPKNKMNVDSRVSPTKGKIKFLFYF